MGKQIQKVLEVRVNVADKDIIRIMKLKWIGVILIITGISILIMLHKSPNETEPVKKPRQSTPISPKTTTIRGEVVEIYNVYGYCLIIDPEENEDGYTSLYEVSVPDSDKSTVFEIGDIVIVTLSYDSFIYDTSPRRLTGIISIEIE